MTDRFDDAKRALEGVPANDVWAEAERRAQDGAVVPLAAVARPPRRVGRWVGAAAVAVLAVGTIAVLADDEPEVSTTPGNPSDVVCGFTSFVTVVPGALQESLAPRDGTPPPSVARQPVWIDPDPTPPYEIASPADDSIVITDDQTTEASLERGQADVRFDANASRLTWAPEGASPCETFSVTVIGAPGDETNELLVHIADGLELTGPVDLEAVAVYQADGACTLGVSGGPLPPPATVSPAETFVEGSVGTLVEGSLNTKQRYAVQVPGQVVTDLVGERVEEVQLHRGTAQLWFQPDAVQLRWFTGSQDACESFTVTVGGGTEDENRHAAVDLGERVLMPSELPSDPTHPTPGANPLANTDWQLESVTVDGESTDGDVSAFSFGDDTLEWTDGCNDKSANYAYADGTLVLDAVGTTDVFCEPNPTSEAINGVLTAGPVEVTFDGDRLILRNLDAELVLRRSQTHAFEGAGERIDGSAFDVTSFIGTSWRIVGLADETTRLFAVPDGEGTGAPNVTFDAAGMGWGDGCNSAGVDVEYTESGINVVSDAVSTAIGCDPHAGTDLINAVLGQPGHVDMERAGDQLVLKRGDQVITLDPI